MSPIMIRPVKEQIEHDRVIRTLDHLFRAKYFAVDANVGDDKKASYKVGPQTHYPDLVLTAPTAPKKMLAIIEVESGESVNRMEAMAEWGHFGRAKAPFQLYVPAATVDIARRIIEDHQISVTELWSFVSVGDDIHFHLVSHASKSFADAVQPGETMPAMPVYIPPPPPPPPAPVEKPVKVEKAPRVEVPAEAGQAPVPKASKAVAAKAAQAKAPASEPAKPDKQPAKAAVAPPKAEVAVKAAPAVTKVLAKVVKPAAKVPKAVKPERPVAKVAAKPAPKAAAKPAAKAKAPVKPAAKPGARKAAKPAPAKVARKAAKASAKPAAKAAARKPAKPVAKKPAKPTPRPAARKVAKAPAAKRR